ncbi:MAG TPA: hypothetical protein VFB89_07690 [Gemmatimonadales bacterium]|nr:hypothetical protein [Gemmatimonadales bacterium]
MALLSCAAVSTLSLAVGLPTLQAHNYFLADDFGLVHHLHNLALSRFLPYFVSDWTEGIYGYTLDELRPVLAFSYWLDSHMFGATNAMGYHATNVALHVLNSVLVFAIARAIVPAQTAIPLLAGAVFALLPSSAEPIAWISGRVDSLTSAFYLGAFFGFLRFRIRHSRPWLAASLVLFAFGLFVKQTVVTFPVLILAYDAVYQPSIRSSTRHELISRYAVQVPFLLLLVLYLGLRATLFDSALRGEQVTLEAFRVFAIRQFFYARSLLPIAYQIPDQAKVALAVFTAGVLVACGRWLLNRDVRDPDVRRHLLFFGVIWYGVTIAPMIVTYPSARHLYLTGAGVSIALALALLPEWWRDASRSMVPRALSVVVFLVLSGIALTLNIRTWIANGVESGRLSASLPVLLRSLPSGSTVMVGIPETRRDAYFWYFALPFALQKPFLPEDLYGQFAIVERPGVYCCLPHQWWAAKRSTLEPILRSSGTRELTYIVPDPRDAGAWRVQKRTVSGPELRMKIENTVGKRLESLAISTSWTDVYPLAKILFE